MTTTEEQPREAMAAQIEARNLREIAINHAKVCNGLADKVPVAGEPDDLWWPRQSALREASVLLVHLAAEHAAIVTALRQAEAAPGVVEAIEALLLYADPSGEGTYDGATDIVGVKANGQMVLKGSFITTCIRARQALARQPTASPPIEVERTVADGALVGEAKWRPFIHQRDVPTDGTWFVARSTKPGFSAVRVVHYADKFDRLPIDHSGCMWPSEPTEWMPLEDFTALASRQHAGMEGDDAVIAEFAFLYREYGLEDDEKLAPDALELKRKVLAAIAAPAPSDEVARLREDMDWFSNQRRLSLAYHAPLYGDDDDQSKEWRVEKEGGSINDREWEVVGRGETAAQAVASARAALTRDA